MLSIADVARRLGVAYQTVRDLDKLSLLPPPVRRGGNALYWRPHQIDEWIRRSGNVSAVLCDIGDEEIITRPMRGGDMLTR